MTEQIAFKMKLKFGVEDEYQRRHDEIWPELSEALKEAGIRDYSIFLDTDNCTLFAVLTSTNESAMSKLPEQAIMQKWWHYMADLMHADDQNRPETINLKRVFHLP